MILLYFWQPSQDAAVRGLAALRDLAKQYKGEPFAIVLVTWPGSAVYPARSDLDGEGRVRYIKPVALRRGAKIAEKQIPAVIDALLGAAR